MPLRVRNLEYLGIGLHCVRMERLLARLRVPKVHSNTKSELRNLEIIIFPHYDIRFFNISGGPLVCDTTIFFRIPRIDGRFIFRPVRRHTAFVWKIRLVPSDSNETPTVLNPTPPKNTKKNRLLERNTKFLNILTQRSSHHWSVHQKCQLKFSLAKILPFCCSRCNGLNRFSFDASWYYTWNWMDIS